MRRPPSPTTCPAVFAFLLTLFASALVSLCLSLLPASAIAAPTAAAASEQKIEAAFTEAKADYLRLRDDKKRRKYRDNWIGVAERLEAVAKKYPKSKRAPDAIFNAARLYSDLYRVSLAERDRLASLEAWEKLYTDYPKSSLADDAHYERGQLCLRGRTPDFACAREELKKAAAMKGDMAAEAKKALDQLPPPQNQKTAQSVQEQPQAKGAKDKDSDRKSALSAGIAKATAASNSRSSEASEKNAAEKKDAKAPAAGAAKAAPQPEEDPGENIAEPEQKMAAALGKASKGEIPLAVQMGLKIRRVIIDAGHGGHDTGAIGAKGTREKDVALSVALKLKAALVKKGYDVKLTREEDKFVALEERARFANRNKGDLFISLHCNAAENRKLSGVETYTLNVASDRYAMRLAALENKSSEKSVSDLQLVLADLARKANLPESLQLARAIHPTIVSAMKDGKKKAYDHGLKQALFFVLLGVRMPSVLVEMGFISNEREEALLKTPERQQMLADSMAQGIGRFIEQRNALASGNAVPNPKPQPPPPQPKQPTQTKQQTKIQKQPAKAVPAQKKPESKKQEVQKPEAKKANANTQKSAQKPKAAQPKKKR